MKRLLLASTAFAMSLGSAVAQTADQEGLVNVNLQDVLSDIALDLNVEENNIPVTVQVPVSVAANVCGVDVNALSVQMESGDATCAAVTGSQELTQIVDQQMAAGDSTDETDDTAATDDGDTTTDDTAGTDDSATEDTAGTDDSATEDDTAGTDTDATDDTAGTDTESTDETTTSGIGSENSARQFAPGQQDEPANEVAPGKQEDPKAAAPGQMKKTIEEEESTTD